MTTAKVGDGIYLINLQETSTVSTTTSYLLLGERSAVVETGPATSAATLLKGIREVGFDPQDLDYLVVTHIHLDHAGGAGYLAQQLPRCKVVVHPRGARHLADPEKLITSARQVWGPKMDEMFGPILPIPQGRLVTPNDGDTLDLGQGQNLVAIESPGHARHHLCFYHPTSKGLFSGDAAGLYFPLIEPGYLRPVCPLPDFNRAQAKASLLRILRDFDVQKVYFSHYGAQEPGHQILERALGQLVIWEDLIAKAFQEKPDRDYVLKVVAQHELQAAGVRSVDESPAIKMAIESLDIAVDGFIYDLQQNPPA